MSGYLPPQVAAGADAVQLFDCWVGALAVEDYAARVLPHTARDLRRAGAARRAAHPLRHRHRGAARADRVEPAATSSALDWRVPLDAGWERVGHDRGVQGNLDPAVLLGPPELVRERAARRARRAGGRPGHVFNLGHGVLPETPLENLQLLVETVHEWEAAHVA